MRQQKNRNNQKNSVSSQYTKTKRGEGGQFYPDHFDSGEVFCDRKGNVYYTGAYNPGHHNNSRHHNHHHHHSGHTSKYSQFHAKKSYNAGITKEEWVLSNYSFLIKPPSQLNYTNEKELRETVSDPDCLINWDTVEVVRYRTEHVEQCPICMDEFVAPRVTKCGHLFCLPCILRYLSDSEYNHRKCPMCNESILLSHLKPVVIESIGRVAVGAEEQFVLMKRRKNSIITYGADKLFPPMCAIHIIHGEPDSEFNRYAVTYDLVDYLSRDLESVKKYAEVNQSDELEVAFLELAQTEISTKIREWNRWASEHLPRGNPAIVEKEKYIQRQLEDLGLSEKEDDNSNVIIKSAKEVLGDDYVEDPTWRKSEYNQVSKQEEEFYYFYQISDGSPVFIDALCSRVLTSEYGDYQHLPSQITAKIVHVDNTKVDDYNRRKSVFMKHLPYNAELGVVEVDLKALVSPETYSKFAYEIDKREHQRTLAKLKEKKMEEIAKRRAEEEEERYRKEMEEAKFIWRDQDFPLVDQYGREIVPESSSFVPLSSTVKRHKKSPYSQWNNSFIPEVESVSTIPSAPPPTINPNSAWAQNNDLFPTLSSNSGKKRRGRK